jgi:hypothetical protein
MIEGETKDLPLSTSARLTQSSSVCAEQPILAEIDNAAAAYNLVCLPKLLVVAA